MNMQSDSVDNGRGNNDDAVGRLIRQAGRRQVPPKETYQEVFHAASQAWHKKVRARRRRHTAFAIAATVLIGLATAILVQQFAGDIQPPVPIARFDYGFGPIMVKNPTDETWRALAEGGPELQAGSSLKVGDAGGVRLRLPGGESQIVSGRWYVSKTGEGEGVYVESGSRTGWRPN